MIVRESREIFNTYKYQSGVDISRVVLDPTDRVEPSLLCKECSKLVVNPYYCSQCKILYCEGCYVTNKQKTCTACHHTVLTNEYPTLYNIMLSKFKIYCRNKSTGCSLILYYENLLEHEDNCHHEPLLCVYPDCDERVKRKSYPYHIKSCKHRILSCPHCTTDFKYSLLDQHLQYCDMRLVECYGCRKQVYNKYLEEHLDICDEIDVVCSKCNQTFVKRDIFNHTEYDCLSQALKKFMVASEETLVTLRGEINKAKDKIKENDAIIETSCGNCKKLACEIALKRCELCRKRQCAACARTNYKSCSSCLKIFCNSCFNHSMDDKMCFNCSQVCIEIPGSSHRKTRETRVPGGGEGASSSLK